MTDEEINEFDSKFGRAYVSDESGGHFVGSYLIEFINKLLKKRTKKTWKNQNTTGRPRREKSKT